LTVVALGIAGLFVVVVIAVLIVVAVITSRD
jgi:hypothetical protein